LILEIFFIKLFLTRIAGIAFAGVAIAVDKSKDFSVLGHPEIK